MTPEAIYALYRESFGGVGYAIAAWDELTPEERRRWWHAIQPILRIKAWQMSLCHEFSHVFEVSGPGARCRCGEYYINELGEWRRVTRQSPTQEQIREAVARAAAERASCSCEACSGEDDA